MLSSDPQTIDSIKRLWGIATTKGHRPLVVWVGAGCSSWLGYERWDDVAQRFHSTFIKQTSSYARREADEALKVQDFPSLFERCFEANPQLYRKLLTESFAPRTMKVVYQRFLQAVELTEGLSIVTTNVDEMLERTMPQFELIQRTDLSRTAELLSSGRPFIAKLHGSISSVDSVIFKKSDYELATADALYLASVRHLLRTCSVVFMGYSIRDRYLIELMEQNANELSLFGEGPHFLISTSSSRSDLPSTINFISYQTNFHSDHRSSILPLELLRRMPAEKEAFIEKRLPTEAIRSAHLLGDVFPAGTVSTGNTLQLLDDAGQERQMIVGPAGRTVRCHIIQQRLMTLRSPSCALTR